MIKIWQKIIRISTFKKTVFVACVLLCVSSFTKSGNEYFEPIIDFSENLETNTDISKNAELEQMLSEAWKKGKFNGSVLYAEKGKIIFNRQYGYENLKTKKPLSDTSVFQLASTSKPFTAIAILKLADQNKVDIDKNVTYYLADFPYPEVTVKQLLQHRSGLPNYMYASDNYWDRRKTLHNDDLSDLLKKANAKLAFKPDSRFQYCNTNYAYLALIVEKVSKKSFAAYMQSEIFDPLGMQHTFIYQHEERNNKHAVKGYSYSKKRGFYERPCDYLDGVVGDKALYSTANDLFIFDQALYNENFISREKMDLAFTPAKEFDAKHQRDYGLGFRLKIDEDGHQLAYHHGWWKGFRTYYIHDYEQQRTLIWLNNRSDVRITDYLAKIMDTSADEEMVLQGGN